MPPTVCMHEQSIRQRRAGILDLLTADGRFNRRHRKALTRMHAQSTLARGHLDTVHAQTTDHVQHLIAEREQVAVVDRALDATTLELQSLKDLHHSLLKM